MLALIDILHMDASVQKDAAALPFALHDDKRSLLGLCQGVSRVDERMGSGAVSAPVSTGPLHGRSRDRPIAHSR